MKRMQKEKQEQKMLVAWFKMQYPALILFAIPNGGSRNVLEAKSLNLEGVKAGVPDLFLAKPSNGLPGLFIELKRSIVKGEAKPVVSKLQKEVIAQLIESGYAVEICYGFDHARQIIISYLNETEK